jgi:hypothetical protein
MKIKICDEIKHNSVGITNNPFMKSSIKFSFGQIRKSYPKLIRLINLFALIKNNIRIIYFSEGQHLRPQRAKYSWLLFNVALLEECY